MRLDFANERVLAVVAHPDDAELLCAGTLARARADGAAIGICVLCQGDKGQPVPPVANLGLVRHAEMNAAAQLLGAVLYVGEYGDGELVDDYPSRLRLVELYRQYRPTLVLAHSLHDYHADHRAAGALAEAASWFCASAGHKTTSPPLESPPALWRMDTVNAYGFMPDVFVDVTEYVELKQEMLACHRSQLRRGAEADFSPLAELMKMQYELRGAQSGVAAAEAFQTYAAWKRGRAW
jgi:LmbE family N-acetylglucosaminyl deacetylase